MAAKACMKNGGNIMRKLAILMGLLLILTVGILPATAITWGEPDGDRHPHVGLVIFDDEGGPAWRCTGTLISPTVFLTAGHCTDGAVAARVWFDSDLSTNDEYPFGGDTSIEAAEIYSHPDYNWGPQSNPHDVGILILAEEVTDIEPANLPEEGFLDALRAEGKLKHGSNRAKFTVVGYGGTLDWPPPVISYDLQRRFAESEHQTLLKVWLRMSQNQATCDGGTCYGDSGGPAFWTEPNGTEILVGITSWGDANCVATGFNYRVDIPETLSFINDVIADLE
jgi:secreted trypsin-like serine protease